MASNQSVINRCNSLFNKEVVVSDHPNWRAREKHGRAKRLLVGKVIGWSWDTKNEDEPQVEVKYGSDFPEGWANQVDTVSLSQVQLVSSPACQPLVRA